MESSINILKHKNNIWRISTKKSEIIKGIHLYKLNGELFKASINLCCNDIFFNTSKGKFMMVVNTTGGYFTHVIESF